MITLLIIVFAAMITGLAFRLIRYLIKGTFFLVIFSIICIPVLFLLPYLFLTFV